MLPSARPTELVLLLVVVLAVLYSRSILKEER